MAGWRFCFIGGVAVQRWGLLRFTEDIEERCVDRASLWRLDDGTVLTTCSAEDLVVHKAFAGRDLDWGDVEGLLVRQHGKLNWNQIRAELAPLLELKGAVEAMDKLDRIQATVELRIRARP
jgi:hypothetical protein